MNVLLIGSGGREHAIAWKLRQSNRLRKLIIAPGNAGTRQHGDNVQLDISDFDAVAEVILREAINLVVVGPEVPLVEGIKDDLHQRPELNDLLIVGPSAAAAQLEGSKAFAKAFMQDYRIPTAGYREFSAANRSEGEDYLRQLTPPIVLKADGLAAGKGVLICEDVETAVVEFGRMLDGSFGTASARVIVEDFLEGIEFSVFVLTDGRDYKILPVAKDYKRIGEGDTGLNTGGMGSVSPVPFVTPQLMQKVEDRIIQPTIKGIRERNLDYRGVIFFGLIRVDSDPYVIEYNCRFGDPETQSVLMRLDNDLLDLFERTARGTLSEVKIQESEQAAATVVLVSGGYPGAYEKGKRIRGLPAVRDSVVFHAGTRLNPADEVITNGGRVLALTSLGTTLTQALAKSNRNAELIEYDGKNYRRDIGLDV